MSAHEILLFLLILGLLGIIVITVIDNDDFGGMA
jgi:hypothetical protein